MWVWSKHVRSHSNSKTRSTWEMDVEIIDAHMHLWTPQTHPWVSKAAKEAGHPAGSFGKLTIAVGRLFCLHF